MTQAGAENVFYRPARFLRRIVLLCAAAGVLLLGGCGLGEEEPELKIMILGTTDVHGYIRQEPEEKRIGYALLQAYAERARQQGYTVYLVDVGDTFKGRQHTDFDSGRSIARLMAAMGYRVMTPGNHDFEHNVTEKDPLYFSNTLLKELSAGQVERARAVCANLTYNGGTVPGFEEGPFVLFEQKNGTGAPLRIVVDGVTTPYAEVYAPDHVLDGYAFHGLGPGEHSHDDITRDIMDTLAARAAPFSGPDDVYILLAHVGNYEYKGANRQPGMITGKDDLTRLPINNLVVLDGHSHTSIDGQRRNNAWYVNCNKGLRAFSETTVKRYANGKVTVSARRIRYQDMRGLTPDPAIAAMVEEIRQKARAAEQAPF